MRIALLEDDRHQAEAMQIWLQAAGHECRWYETGEAFMEAVGGGRFDLLILDWILPDTSGDRVLAWARSRLDWPIPIIFVTRRDAEQDVVQALEQGADDFMTKPVKPLEMLARITALGRRVLPHAEQEDVLEFGSIRFSTVSRTAQANGRAIELTQKEFDLALFLFRNIGRLLSRPHIMECVWGCTADLNTRTVDTHVSRIRNKLGLLPEHGWRLSAVYQHGYRLERLEQTAAEARLRE